MYYNARYDTPVNTFTQPDTIIPGDGANPQRLNRRCVRIRLIHERPRPLLTKRQRCFVFDDVGRVAGELLVEGRLELVPVAYEIAALSYFYGAFKDDYDVAGSERVA